MRWRSPESSRRRSDSSSLAPAAAMSSAARFAPEGRGRARIAAMLETWLPQAGTETAVVSGAVGLLLLLAGRRLFWLALATAGFLTGFLLLPRILPEAGEVLRWTLAIGGGIGGALLAVFVQRFAVGVAGFLLGGYGTLMLLEALAFEPAAWAIAFYLGGGILAALLAALLFEGALIALSALLGAAVLVGLYPLPGMMQLWLFLVLTLVGVAVQARGWRR